MGWAPVLFPTGSCPTAGVNEHAHELNDAERLAIMQLRALPRYDDEDADLIEALDEVGDLLPMDSKKEVRKEAENIDISKTECQDIETALVANAREICARDPRSGASKFLPSSRARDGLRTWRGLSKCPAGDISQQEASAMCPPGAYIWRALSNRAWAGHMPPHKRISAPWAQYTHRGAALNVLQRLWGLYLAGSDVQCPVEDLMGPQPVQEGAASSSSGAAPAAAAAGATDPSSADVDAPRAKKSRRRSAV